MAVDPFEVGRLALADFGVAVQVTPAGGGEPYVIAALLATRPEDIHLGQSQGHLGGHVFRCLPEAAALLNEGDLLAVDGHEYAVFEIFSFPGQLTEIRALVR
ncbi:head-tail joining protein [Desulfobulbus elongatus]|uniref:head-tail joining protein n=1 Tax=Desulfobulbus elongatus TaxID=53332 RepID=UPI0004828528|nr:hypothetical protein [Desulfobulbus elongatus]